MKTQIFGLLSATLWVGMTNDLFLVGQLPFFHGKKCGTCSPTRNNCRTSTMEQSYFRMNSSYQKSFAVCYPTLWYKSNMLRRKKKTVHFIRHAESEHNTPPRNIKLRDPYLTLVGRMQAECLGNQFPHIDDVDLIVSSPMKRALQTTIIAFHEHLKNTKQEIIALPELQELSNKACDTGSSLAELLTEFRDDAVDFSRVPHDWESKDRQWAPTEQRTLARMSNARIWLRNRPETNILVIGHAHCTQLLTREAGEDYDNDGIQEVQLGYLPPWLNCEWRTFTMEEEEGKVVDFVETKSSKKNRARGQNVPQISEDRKDSKDAGPSSTESSKSRSPPAKWSLKSARTSSKESVLKPGAREDKTSPSKEKSMKDTRKVFSFFS